MSVTLDSLIEEAVRTIGYLAAERRIRFVREIPPGLPELMVDRSMVARVMVNLISNARHATTGMVEPPPRVTLGVTLLDGHVLRMTVADNGSGIAPENLTRIFAHGFTTRKSGNGFGLHSCVIAAQEMGGSLTAHSDGAGLGTRAGGTVGPHRPRRTVHHAAIRARRLGSVLFAVEYLAACRVRRVAEIQARLRADLEALPADVREHGDCHRQRPG